MRGRANPAEVLCSGVCGPAGHVKLNANFLDGRPKIARNICRNADDVQRGFAIRTVIAMRAVVFLATLWLVPFLYFGWRACATWPSKQESERQREVSKLYDWHFEGRRRSHSNKQATSLPRPRGGGAIFVNRRQRTFSAPVA